MDRNVARAKHTGTKSNYGLLGVSVVEVRTTDTASKSIISLLYPRIIVQGPAVAPI